jgi:hypothetical protein
MKGTPNPSRDSAEWQELTDIEEQTNTTVTDTFESLRVGLSSEGFARFQARMVEFKRTIKAFPTPKSQSGE